MWCRGCGSKGGDIMKLPYIGQPVRIGAKNECRYGEIRKINHYTFKAKGKQLVHRYQLWIGMLSGKTAFCDYSPGEQGAGTLL